jgi:hypothetical protein
MPCHVMAGEKEENDAIDEERLTKSKMRIMKHSLAVRVPHAYRSEIHVIMTSKF